MFVSGLDRAEIQYLNSNGEWKTFVDLLDDVELSRIDQIKIHLFYIFRKNIQFQNLC